MAEALPIELRQRAVAACKAGEGSYPTVARRFGIGQATLKRVWQVRDVGHLRPTKEAGGTPSECGASAHRPASSPSRHSRAPSQVVKFWV